MVNIYTILRIKQLLICATFVREVEIMPVIAMK